MAPATDTHIQGNGEGVVLAPKMANGPTGNSTGSFVTKKNHTVTSETFSGNILAFTKKKTAKQAVCGCGWPLTSQQFNGLLTTTELNQEAKASLSAPDVEVLAPPCKAGI